MVTQIVCENYDFAFNLYELIRVLRQKAKHSAYSEAPIKCYKNAVLGNRKIQKYIDIYK